MNCEEFELLMADALGGELSAADRPALEAHLAGCERCRRDFESSRQTLNDMRALPGTRKVRARREGNRLVIEDAATERDVAPIEGAIAERDAAGRNAAERSAAKPDLAGGTSLDWRTGSLQTGGAPARSRFARFMASPLRYAAGLLIAFTAGYAMHAGLTLADAARLGPPVAVAPPQPAPSFEGSVMRAYARNSGRSDLAKCLIAMSPPRP